MKLYSVEDTYNFSRKIGKVITNGDVILLYGEIGVGKTTFVRGLINNLEIKEGLDQSQILSPTFNIVFDYEIKKIKIMHCDLYRIKNTKDINELGIFNDTKDHITLIEWPELIKEKPQHRIDIFFSYLEKNFNRRKINIKGYGKWAKYDFERF